eukprot:GAFH01001586.1.p1 GENE.GAFH01001586.1~~GAFH01001586.1.p1  ORF type:complete len:368 (+),score=54.01 GAFH01001586.1:385-1488(+)
MRNLPGVSPGRMTNSADVRRNIARIPRRTRNTPGNCRQSLTKQMYRPRPRPPMINDQPEAPLSPAYLHADEYGSQSETREQDLGDGARMVTTTTHRPGFVSSTTTEIHPGGSFYSSITSSSSSRLDDVPPVAPRRSPMPPMPQYVAPSVPAPAGEAQQPMGVWPLRSLRQMMDLLGQDFDDPEMSAQLASRLHPMRAYGGPFEGIQGGALPRYDEMRGGRDGMTLGSMDLMGGMPMMVPMMALLGGMGGMGGGVQPSYEDLIRLGDRIGPAVPQNASREEIEQLPTTKFHPGSLPKDKATCAICLSDYEPGESLKILPCLHIFHQECIDHWLASNHVCPICKTSVRVGAGPDDRSECGPHGPCHADQ